MFQLLVTIVFLLLGLFIIFMMLFAGVRPCYSDDYFSRTGTVVFLCFCSFFWVILHLLSCIQFLDDFYKIQEFISSEYLTLITVITAFIAAFYVFILETEPILLLSHSIHSSLRMAEKDESFVNAKRICKKGQITVNEKMALEKIIREYELLEHKILLSEKKLKNYQIALLNVRTLHEEALQRGTYESDKELRASYLNIAEELNKEVIELQNLVSDFQKQLNENNARHAEILKLFKQAEKKAKTYREYDAFTAHVLKTQKGVKETLLVTNEVK